MTVTELPPDPPEEPRADAPTGAAAAAPKRRVSRWAWLALGLAVLVLGAGALVAWHGRTEDANADTARAAASRRLIRARADLRGTQAELDAANGAVATFEVSAGNTVTANAAVVDLQHQVADLLTRLRATGDTDDVTGYNRTVDQLNGQFDQISSAYSGLEAPLLDFSNALESLPTARCAGPVSAKLVWTPYGGNGLQCARLRVPLSYDDLDAAQIDITVVRRPADDPATSLGPLVLNPGGPGGSGIAFMRDAILLLPPDLLRRFDLVTFDPRGVGQSSPVDCADDLDPLFNADLTSPSTRTRRAAVRAIAKIARGCAARTGRLLQHVDTVSAAKDIDQLREALGVEQLNYLGFSYGTYLGAVYADLFPKRIRAAVLDGAVDPSGIEAPATVSDYGGFRDSLDDALGDCATRPDCPFYSGGDPQSAFDALMTNLVTAPIEYAGRSIGRNQAEIAVASGLYEGVDGWPDLMTALAQAKLGSGGPLSALSDRYTGRRPNGSYSNETEAQYAVNCLDSTHRLTPAQAWDRVDALPKDPNRFDASGVALELPCAFWPAPAHDAPGKIDAIGAAPILVVGGEHDPATPIAGAEALAGSLKSGVLLRWEGSGHTAFARGNKCIDDAVVAYLVDLTVPKSDTTCPAENPESSP